MPRFIAYKSINCVARVRRFFTEAADYEEGVILAAHKSKKLAFGGRTWA